MHSIAFLDRGTLAPSVCVRRSSLKHGWTDFEPSDIADVASRLRRATIAIHETVAPRRETVAHLAELAAADSAVRRLAARPDLILTPHVAPGARKRSRSLPSNSSTASKAATTRNVVGGAF